jgi:hypothetical protein
MASSAEISILSRVLKPKKNPAHPKTGGASAKDERGMRSAIGVILSLDFASGAKKAATSGLFARDVEMVLIDIDDRLIG